MPQILHVAHMHGMPDADPYWLDRQAEWVPRAVLAAREVTFHAGKLVPAPGLTAVAVTLPTGTVAKPKALAEVRHGRWAARCPFCTSAQEVSPTDRRFWCVGCLNEAVGNRWVTVMWPADQAAIEQLLSWRPALNANWFPHETLADLRAENLEHNLPADG